MGRRYFTRGANYRGNSDIDFKVQEIPRQKLALHDVDLKKFRYRDALDRVLLVSFVSDHVTTTLDFLMVLVCLRAVCAAVCDSTTVTSFILPFTLTVPITLSAKHRELIDVT